MIGNLTRSCASYFAALPEQIGADWNRFWFTPSDPLPASILRILVGLACLYFVGSYTFDLERWLGPAGLMPPAAVASSLNADELPNALNYHISVFNYLPEMVLVWLVHVVCLAVVLAFTAGVWTTLSGWLTFAAVLMYLHRNPLVTSEFEPVLAMLVLYVGIAPAGAYFSVDRWLEGRGLGCSLSPVEPSWRTTVGMRLLQIHLTGLYVAMVLSQLSVGNEELHPWWVGESAWYLAAKGESTLVDFTWMRNSLFLVNAWTHAIVLFEIAFAGLVWNSTFRPLLILLSLLHWTLLGLLSGLAPFAALMVVAGLGFVTAAEWRSLCEPPRESAADEEPAKAVA